MARSVATNKSMSPASLKVTNYPFSFDCWINANSSTWLTVFIARDAGTATFYGAYIDASLKAQAQVLVSGATQSAITTTSVGTAVWFHAAFIFASTTSRTVYLNGAGVATNAVSSQPGTITVNAIGDSLSDCSVAFPRLWSRALTASDALSLSKGAGPRMIPGAISSLRLTGGLSPEPDLFSSGTWTLGGTPPEVINPRIYAP